MSQTGGAAGLRDLGALESSVAQPRQTFEGNDLYPTLAAKATALAFSLLQNHAFVDGNKRTAHGALETMLILNGYELQSSVNDAEQMVMAAAAGQAARDQLLHWVEDHLAAL